MPVVVTIPAPLNDDAPVPPLATANVPDMVIVPELVIGPPVNDMPVVPPDTSTLVTVPLVATLGGITGGAKSA